MKTATERVSQLTAFTAAGMIEILSDRSHGAFLILRPYLPDEVLRHVGTVATIVMDLPARELFIRKGNDAASSYGLATLDHPTVLMNKTLSGHTEPLLIEWLIDIRAIGLALCQ